MRIANCPKGGRIPTGYCTKSCLNFVKKSQEEKIFSHRNLEGSPCGRPFPIVQKPPGPHRANLWFDFHKSNDLVNCQAGIPGEKR